MKRPPPHRWFHALVVTGASITACGGQTDDSAADAATDTPLTVDGTSVDVASSDSDAGNPIIITVDAGGPEDTRNDPRCCTITR